MKSFPKNSIFVRAVEKWGVTSQIKQTIEECAELIVSFSHHARDKCDNEAVISELADVAIMLEQMKYIYGIDEFEKAYAAKIARLEDKLKHEIL